MKDNDKEERPFDSEDMMFEMRKKSISNKYSGDKLEKMSTANNNCCGPKPCNIF